MMRTLPGMRGPLPCVLLLVLLPGSCSRALREEGVEGMSSSVAPALVYHGTPWLERYLRHVAEAFPTITRLYSIGRSVESTFMSAHIVNMLCIVEVKRDAIYSKQGL